MSTEQHCSLSLSADDASALTDKRPSSSQNAADVCSLTRAVQLNDGLRMRVWLQAPAASSRSLAARGRKLSHACSRLNDVAPSAAVGRSVIASNRDPDVGVQLRSAVT